MLSRHVVLTRDVLRRAGDFFEERGADGCEGSALIAGEPGYAADHLVVPDQVAGRYPRCYVEITDQGDIDMMTALSSEERYVARIHSHPGDAFHSETDDNNPVLTHEGAVSIVAPFFGLGLRHGLDACAIFVLQSGVWVELESAEQRRGVVVG